MSDPIKIIIIYFCTRAIYLLLYISVELIKDLGACWLNQLGIVNQVLRTFTSINNKVMDLFRVGAF